MKQPNILLFLIDDLGWADLGCFGSSFYETPRLDRLASQGLRFTNAYASCPVCSPTRASIMSGKYPARVGITNWIGATDRGMLDRVPYLHYLPKEEVSVATALREYGYKTWHVGKWHLGDDGFLPEDHGFDVNVAGAHWGGPKNGYFAPWSIPGYDDGKVPEGTYLTDHLTDRAIDLIASHSGDQPFYLNFNHYAVHTPLQAPQALVEKYEAKARAMGLDGIDPIVVGEHFPCEHKRHMHVERRKFQSHPVYAAMVENMDYNIGRVLDALEAAGMTDDTLVVFTSDNGGLATAEGSSTCNFPLSEGKGWSYEGGTRVSQIARWPAAIRAGSVTTTPVTSTDLYPTFLTAAGAPLRPEQHVDGCSFSPLFSDPTTTIDREAIYWHYPHYGNQGGTPYCSAVSGCGRWKLIEFFEDGAQELYDLVHDVSETRNCADAYPDRVTAMSADLARWRDDVCAKIPEPNPDWEPAVPSVPNNAHE